MRLCCVRRKILSSDDEIAKLKALLKGVPTGDIEWAPLTPNRSTHKPGTEEWFKESFGHIGDKMMPLGFRGRKKK